MDDRPLCFVLMPFGTKKDPAGGSDIDFDSMYEQGLRPGIEDAGMEPLRADEERTGGIIQGASETYGLIGRIYKDLWMEARKANDRWTQQSRLDQAIAAYVSGVERDWRDAYPGINAVTLLDIKGDPESLKRRDELLPVVRFAVRQRFRSAAPEYWDYATLLELAVLASNETEAHRTLGDALTHVREVWEPETTANNLRLIRDARAQRTQPTAWLDEIIEALTSAATA